MSKTRVLTVRVEENLYKKLKGDANSEGVAQYVRGLVYDFYYSRVKLEELHKTIEMKGNKISDFLKLVEERKARIEESIKTSKESIEHLQDLNRGFDGLLKDLSRMVKEGIEEFPSYGGKR